MTTIALYGKGLGPEHASYLQLMLDKLKNTGYEVYFYEPFWKKIKDLVEVKGKLRLFTTHAELADTADFLFSIGGDGTLLDTITLIRDSGIPVLGINLGRLGFLSSVPKDKIIKALDDINSGSYRIEERSLLRLDSEQNLFGETNYALNELTLHKQQAYSMLTIKACVNGKFINSYWADGLIVATPTGSTAYSMSCGGPIVTPDSCNMIITPIATHNLTVRPIVIPDTSEVTLMVEGRNHKYNLGLDSRYVSMDKPIELKVSKEKFGIKLLQLEHEAFFNTIRKKLNWGLDNRN